MGRIYGGGLDLTVEIAETAESPTEDLEWVHFISLAVLPAPLVLTERASVRALNPKTEQVLSSLSRAGAGMIVKDSRGAHYIVVDHSIVAMEGNLTISKMLNSSIATVVDSKLANDPRLETWGPEQRLKLRSVVINAIEIKKYSDPRLEVSALYDQLVNLLS